MKLRKKELRKVLMIMTALFVAVLILVIFNSRDILNLNSGEGKQNKYEFESIQMSLIKPVGWEISEKSSYVDLIKNNEKINLSRSGTNFDNIMSYLRDFDSKRNLEIEMESTLRNNDYDVIQRIEKFNGGSVNKQKVYYIYVNNWVYALSTSSEDLYDDLDQIAKSFKYTGN